MPSSTVESEPSAYITYSTPPFSIQYSHYHFASLRLKDTPAAIKDCLSILPPGFLKSATYSEFEPPSSVISLYPGEFAIHSEDIARFCPDSLLNSKFDEGFRSLDVQYYVPGTRELVKKSIHFAQVRCFDSVSLSIILKRTR